MVLDQGQEFLDTDTLVGILNEGSSAFARSSLYIFADLELLLLFRFGYVGVHSNSATIMIHCIIISLSLHASMSHLVFRNFVKEIFITNLFCWFTKSWMKEVATYHNACSSFSCFAMYHCYVLLILLKPFCNVITKWFYVIKLWRMMIVKWKMSDPAVKFSRIVNALGAQVIYFKVVLEEKNETLICVMNL